LGFGKGFLPFIYLGVPICSETLRVNYLQPLADTVKLKLTFWKGKMLSIMGWIQLVNMTIVGILGYKFKLIGGRLPLRILIDGPKTCDINKHDLVNN